MVRRPERLPRTSDYRAPGEAVSSGNPGDSRSVGEGVFELRIHFGPGYRVYFVRRGVELILLLCGGSKSSQQANIARAKKLAGEEAITYEFEDDRV